MSALATSVLLQSSKVRCAGVAYVITNRANGKRYVGITRRTPKARWAAHKRRVPTDQHRPLYRAILKYGIDAFTFEVVASSWAVEDLGALERILVAQFGTFWRDGGGYNLTAGGPGPLKRGHTEATRAKMSVARKGKKFSDAHKKAIAAALTGRKHSDAARAKISKALAVRPMSDRALNAFIERNTGQQSAAQVENRRRCAVARSLAVLTPTGRFASVTAAAREHGISHHAAHYRAECKIFGWSFAA